jgi:hypothetical protein
MKPAEILGMIEEASGTRMFEERKEKAVKTMAKKDKKVEEIASVSDPPGLWMCKRETKFSLLLSIVTSRRSRPPVGEAERGKTCLFGLPENHLGARTSHPLGQSL